MLYSGNGKDHGHSSADRGNTMQPTSRPNYGRTLQILGTADSGPVMDCAVSGNFLYAAGAGRLRIFSLEEPFQPRFRGELAGLGNTRQIEIADSTAHITSREDGYFQVDVTDPAHPVLLSHYDTIEMATGIAVAGSIAFIACRTYGVELVDISDPMRPAHIGTIRTGEAQSLRYHGGNLYTGVWATGKVVVADVRNLRRPEIISRIELDGYGDGLFLRGRLLYAATGHHARGLAAEDASDPAFGGGHGLEIFDISDPRRSVLLSRLKAPRCYQIRMDMWDVEVSGNYAYWGDTWNGLFAVDVSDPASPRFTARLTLPEMPLDIPDRPASPPVNGFAVGGGCLYVASVYAGLQVVPMPEARPLPPPSPAAPALSGPVSPPVPSGFRCYRPGGQVYAAAVRDDLIGVAAGAAGLHILDRETFSKRVEFPTSCVCCDVAFCNALLFAAEGAAGLSIRRVESDGTFPLIGHYRTDQPIRQVTVPFPGKFALVQVGNSELQILDLSDPASPHPVLRDTRFGLLYGHQIGTGLVDRRYANCYWHVSGIYWYDLSGDRPQYAGIHHALRVDSDSGVAVYRNRPLIVNGPAGRYFRPELHERRPFAELPSYGIPGLRLRGIPSVSGDLLRIADRASGEVTVLDISEPEQPRLQEHFTLPGNPGTIVPCGSGWLIPAGYQGLLFKA